LKKCSSNNDDDKWNIEESDVEKASDYNPLKYKGKTIILVDSENPWYLNYDTTIPIKYNQKQIITEKEYRANSDYGSNENLEFENFKNTNTNNNKNKNESTTQNQIICLLLIIVVILIIYKKFVKNKYNEILQ
jgi:hypothetical protein